MTSQREIASMRGPRRVPQLAGGFFSFVGFLAALSCTPKNCICGPIPPDCAARDANGTLYIWEWPCTKDQTTQAVPEKAPETPGEPDQNPPGQRS